MFFTAKNLSHMTAKLLPRFSMTLAQGPSYAMFFMKLQVKLKS